MLPLHRFESHVCPKLGIFSKKSVCLHPLSSFLCDYLKHFKISQYILANPSWRL